MGGGGAAALVLVVDTREQEPYGFTADEAAVVRKALPAGDYSVAGLEREVAVERKSLEDFVSTVIRARPRFLREVEALARYAHACVIVEGGLADVLAHRYRSGAHPSAVLGAAVSLCVDHGVPVFFCSDRQSARTFTLSFLRRARRAREAACPASHLPTDRPERPAEE